VTWACLSSGCEDCLSRTVCAPPVNTPFPAYYGMQLTSALTVPGSRLVGVASGDAAVNAHAAVRPDGSLVILAVNTDPSKAKSVGLLITGYRPLRPSPFVPMGWAATGSAARGPRSGGPSPSRRSPRRRWSCGRPGLGSRHETGLPARINVLEARFHSVRDAASAGAGSGRGAGQRGAGV